MTSDLPPPGPPRRRLHLRGGLFVTFGVVYGVWLVLGVLDSLVWMPQLIAPSVPLDEIHAVLTDAGSAPGAVAAPVLWFLFWAAAGLTYLLVFLPVHRAFYRIATSTSTLAVTGIGTVLFGAMSFFQWFSGFGIGMPLLARRPALVVPGIQAGGSRAACGGFGRAPRAAHARPALSLAAPF